MHLRITRLIVAPERIDALIRAYEATGIVEPRAADGFAGCGLLVRRETGELGESSLWESARDLAASELTAERGRAQAAADESTLRVVDVARFELLWRHRTDERTRDEAAVRIDVGSLPPAGLEAFATFVRSDLAPGLRVLPGYESILVAGDRTSGIVAVFTEWRTAPDRERADPSFLPVLRRAAEFDLRPIEVQRWERPAITAF